MKEKAELPSDLPNRFILEITFPKTNVDRKLKIGARPAVSGSRGVGVVCFRWSVERKVNL